MRSASLLGLVVLASGCSLIVDPQLDSGELDSGLPPLELLFEASIAESTGAPPTWTHRQTAEADLLIVMVAARAVDGSSFPLLPSSNASLIVNSSQEVGRIDVEHVEGSNMLLEVWGRSSPPTGDLQLSLDGEYPSTADSYYIASAISIGRLDGVVPGTIFGGTGAGPTVSFSPNATREQLTLAALASTDGSAGVDLGPSVTALTTENRGGADGLGLRVFWQPPGDISAEIEGDAWAIGGLNLRAN